MESASAAGESALDPDSRAGIDVFIAARQGGPDQKREGRGRPRIRRGASALIPEGGQSW
jgi:hypothetical protein